MEVVVQEGADLRRENLPVGSEVAAIIPDVLNNDHFRDIILAERHAEDGRTISYNRIHGKHPAYLSLAYPLMFPFGDNGFDIRLPLGDVRQRGRKRKFVSLRQYYRYFLYPRDRSSLIPFGFCRLFQQFVVDAWALIDQEQLNYIYYNQKTIRKDIRTGLSDTVFHHDVHPRDLSQSILLPASYTGSPQFMSRYY